MKVTVAICTWNRCALLAQTLEQLTKVVVPAGVEWDILVVDNNCTDATVATATSFVGRLPIRVTHEAKPGLSHARNHALAVAKSDYILWTDDDVLVDLGWIAQFAEAVRRYPEAAAFGGPIEPWFVETPERDLCDAFPALRAGFCGLDDVLDAGPLPEHAPIFGANMGFRIAAIEGMTFDANLGVTPGSAGGGEESKFLRDLQRRGGQAIWWPGLRVKHYVLPERTTLTYLLKFSREKGREQVRLHADDDARASRILGVPRWVWRRWAAAAAGTLAAQMGARPSLPDRLYSGPVPAGSYSKRTHDLLWRRERLFLAGMIEAFRNQAVK